MKTRIEAFIRSCEHETPTESTLDRIQAELFEWQQSNVSNYGRFSQLESNLGCQNPTPVPTPLFQRFRFCAGEAQIVFRTSGTTTGRRGVHAMPDSDVYELSIRTAIQRLPLHIPTENTVSLCPNVAEFPDSSLGHMVATISPHTQHFFSQENGLDAQGCWRFIQANTTPLFLASTALGLADLLATGNTHALPVGSVLMLTGGYKGQKRSIPEEKLHEAAALQLGPHTQLVREYGMTELSSQLWDTGEGYVAPPWLRVYTIDPSTGKRCNGIGQLCFIDLANWGSCMAIETMDLGIVDGNKVELIGRIPGMKARGCSLHIEEWS